MTLKSYGIVQISKNMHPLQGVVDYDVVWYRFTHILQDSLTGTGEILRVPQYRRNNPEKYG